MARLTKPERHALRQWVRAHMVMTDQTLFNMQPAHARIACAEMRKRGWNYDNFRCVWTSACR